MALEVEAKFKIDSHETVRAALQELGARCRGHVLETNQIFDNTQRSLLAADCGLRIRTCRDENGKVVYACLTYKGPRRNSSIKEREEIEFWVGDSKTAQAFLEALGYNEVLSFEKKRETWRLNECSIELDELPLLGLYVEIEGPDEQQVRHLGERMQLPERAMERDSYIALLIRYCDQAGISRRVRFS
jgi:adenylate cyclase, class 2